MMANGALVVLAIVCMWLANDVTAGVAGRYVPRLGFPLLPVYRRVPPAGSAGVVKGNRRYRRDFGGYGYRGFVPGGPAWGTGYGMGAPVGDYGQDFGYASDNWRST